MARALTAKGILNKRPTDVRQEIPDSTPMLYLVIQPSGARRFALRYRFGGEPRNVKLAKGLSLAAARKIAADAALQLEQSIDPRDARRADKAKIAAAQADTVDHHVAAFAKLHVSKLRSETQRQYGHILEDIVLPAWTGRTVHSITRRDVRELIEGVAEGGKVVMANRTLAIVAKLFNWLCERDVITATPCTGVKRPTKEEARDRVLSDDEIKALWLACDKIGEPGGTVFKLLLLLGQRRGEVAGMCRSEIDSEGVWHIPASRMKGKRAHDLPLPAKALALIDAMPVINGNDRVFPPMQFAHVKERLDAHMKTAPWRTHDLRRTVASGMARLGIALPVIEKALAHRSGTFAGIVDVYQRHSFSIEMRAALERWAEHVERLVSGEPSDNVVSLRR
jgi:integrase